MLAAVSNGVRHRCRSCFVADFLCRTALELVRKTSRYRLVNEAGRRVMTLIQMMVRGRKKVDFFSTATMSQALDSPPRPFKRQRTEEGHDNSETDIQEDDTFWFPDGNIVLVSEERKAFRVHLGVLAMHCQFFKDMVNNAHADGTHVKLEDTSRHIFWLLSFIYTPKYARAKIWDPTQLLL